LEEELATISQQNDLGNGKIDELESTNLQIQEERAKGEEMLTKQKELYAELSTINDEMEKELHENKTKVRELTRENQQVLQEKVFSRSNQTPTFELQYAKACRTREKLASGGGKRSYAIDHLRNRQNFDLNKSRQKFHYSLKEHHKISNIPKFRCEML
jgi:chromosome segregation ATPase